MRRELSVPDAHIFSTCVNRKVGKASQRVYSDARLARHATSSIAVETTLP